MSEQFQLKNIYLRDPQGVIKGPYPLAATTTADGVVYQDNEELFDPTFENVQAALDFLFAQSKQTKNIFTDALYNDEGILLPEINNALLLHEERLNTLETSDVLDEDDRAKLDMLGISDNTLSIDNDPIATYNYVDKKIIEAGSGVITLDSYLQKSEAIELYAQKSDLNNLTDRVLTLETNNPSLENYYTKEEINLTITSIENQLGLFPQPTEDNKGQILRSNGANWIVSTETTPDLSGYVTIASAEETYLTKTAAASTYATTASVEEQLKNFDALPQPESESLAFLKWDGSAWVAEPLKIYMGEASVNE